MLASSRDPVRQPGRARSARRLPPGHGSSDALRLSRLAREISDQVVSIPMGGRSESLNASVAAAIALYELSGVRERQGLA